MSELTMDSLKRDKKQIKKKKKDEKHYMQWYWDTDWQGEKYKAIYYGPRLDWMKLSKKKESEDE